MTTTLIIIGYLVGCVVAYVGLRAMIKKSTLTGDKYTVADRRANFAISVFSWATAIVVFAIWVIHCFFEYFFNSDKDTPASW